MLSAGVYMISFREGTPPGRFVLLRKNHPDWGLELFLYNE